MSIRLPVHEHSRACVCMCVCVRVYACMHARTYVLVTCADPLSWPSGLDPLPLTKILDPSMGPPGCPSIYPLKIVFSDQLGRLACLDEVSIDAHL